MNNWFATRVNKFDNVFTSDDKLDAVAFLMAAHEFATILDTQTSIVFRPVRSRFDTNISQMSNHYFQYHEKVGFRTMDDLVRHSVELAGGVDQEGDTPIRGIMWYNRASNFLIESFANSLQKPEEPLVTSLTNSYDRTLAHHHSRIVQPLFHAAMTVCPERSHFYSQLANGDSMEATLSSAHEYFTHMAHARTLLSELCYSYGLDVSIR